MHYSRNKYFDFLLAFFKEFFINLVIVAIILFFLIKVINIEIHKPIINLVIILTSYSIISLLIKHRTNK